MTATTALVLSLTATAAGTGYSAYSARQKGKAEQALNNHNAAVNDQSALDAQRDSRIKATAQRARSEKLKARQRALYASAGVNIATGSPLLVQVAQAGELEMAALEEEVAGNTAAARLRQQAVTDRMAGASARRAGRFDAAATILTGVQDMARTGLRYHGVG